MSARTLLAEALGTALLVLRALYGKEDEEAEKAVEAA